MDSKFLNEIPETEHNAFMLELMSLNSKIEDFNGKTLKMLSSIDNIDYKHGISYLDAKNTLLSLYVNEILGFVGDKLGGSVSEKRIKKLVNLKVTQEKMKAIDKKMESQLDKYQRIANGESETQSTLKPNIFELAVDDEEEIQSKSKFLDKDQSKYAPSKLYFNFSESTDDKKKRQKDIDKKKDKIQNSEFYKEMKNELSEKPAEEGVDDTHLGRYMKEVDDYERDHYTPVLISKKKIKQLKKKDRKEQDIGNFANELNLESIFREEQNEKKESYAKDEAFGKFKKQQQDIKRKAAKQSEQEGFTNKKRHNKF